MSDVRIRPDGQTAHLRPGETVLTGLFRAGFAYRVGCRRGGCGICKVDLVDGEVDYERPVADAVLSEDERAAGTCLSCRAVPRGDITIALREDTLRVCTPLLRYLNAARPEPPAVSTTTTAVKES